MTELVFPDAQGYADLATLVRRARQADPEAVVRLQVAGQVLRVWVGVLPGAGLLADGAAVGVRGIQLAGAPGDVAHLDIVCASAALTDRFAHDGDGASRLSVPPASTYAAWAGVLPAPSGWSPAGSIPAGDLIDVARDGIARIAEGVDVDHTGVAAGTLAVQELRRRVWARSVPIPATDGEGLPAGAAFAAYVLGFVPEPDATVRVFRSGRWVRLQTAAGHVVARP